ncbi:DUF2793 domain-containing protein [Pseudomonas nitroreducens]|uniref:DUF2793 domain-containing protein n=1 Tax=Pseudomonas nitroreducens TaxID=46680 RepID=UPI001475AB04|nr:DUF2793 domain-containing protein [Pseudomonas nitroreducens]NMZ77660.1 DUF2793 domain-containing protein [Pseudomonas nitroreducens]
MSTPNIGLTTLTNSQGQYLNANETFAIIDALLGKVVKDKDLSAPPGSPANGDVYIVAASPTGLWAGHATHIAFWSSDAAAWEFVVPKEGWKFEPTDEDVVYRFDGAAWMPWSSGGGGMTNPMTTQGDIIVGGSAGAPARLAKGTDGQVLTMVSGSQAWATPSGGSAGLTISSKSAEYTLVLGDANTGILHPAADATARTFTIPSNASVAFPVGTAITFINENSAGAVTITITTDTLQWLGAPGGSGSRTLAANGMATALKITSTKWLITGTNLT